MAKTKTKQSTAPKGADFPVKIFADPNIDGVKLTRDLSMVGLKLGMDKEGNTWLQKEEAGWPDRLPEDRRLQVMEGLLGVLDHCRAAANLPPVKEPRPTIEKRIDEQRGDLFDAQAIVDVVRRTISTDIDFSAHAALQMAYNAIDRIATELELIALDARGAGTGAALVARTTLAAEVQS